MLLNKKQTIKIKNVEACCIKQRAFLYMTSHVVKQLNSSFYLCSLERQNIEEQFKTTSK